jgi:hypothetical protein
VPGGELTWSGSLHQTFRLLPQPSPSLRPFLEADGLTPEELLTRLPYARSRAGDGSRSAPDPKRYRDGRQVYQNAGLLYETSGRVRVTALGEAVRRWLDIITPKNRVLLARHAAYALAACQLRNPTGAGERYDESVVVFPFSFIWRAMLQLDGRISSDELNRGLFKVRDATGLEDSIKAIRDARKHRDVSRLGPEVITGQGKNDRIIPWMALASFGWTLFPDKRDAEEAGFYELPADTRSVVVEASQVRHIHRDFSSTEEYVEHIARCAALPKDLR